MKKSSTLFICCLILLVASYSVFIFINEDDAKKLSREDGLIEMAAPVFYIFAAIIMAVLFFKLELQQKHFIPLLVRNIFFILLALFLFICAGEEISWGQRILKIESPEYFEENNAQKEINLHNLWIFQSYDTNKENKTGLQKWLSSARIYTYIWFLYCFLIPFLTKISSKIYIILENLKIPYFPLWIGILFLMNHILSKIFENISKYPNIIEVKETNFSFLYFIASISLYYLYKPSIDTQTK